MKLRALTFATWLVVGLCSASAHAGDIYSISYTDIAQNSAINLTTAGPLDWVKWGNGETSGTTYATPEQTGGTIINPTLTPVGSVPAGDTVTLIPFAPTASPSPTFSWTNGTIAMYGGNPVGTSVSETIIPAQSSYPLGLGLSFQVTASATPQLLDLYVVGFNARMEATATLSGGGQASLIASNAALIPVASGGSDNYFSFGVFSIDYVGAGQTLTVTLTANNQSGIPTTAPQYGFANAGVFAATVSPGFTPVPEPSSLILSLVGIAGLAGFRILRRTPPRDRTT
jgi:hypothetical protein